MKPILLFCNSVLAPRQPDEMFEEEYAAAKAAGFQTLLFSDNRLAAGDIRGSLGMIAPFAAPTPVIYRGWMLKESAYRALDEGLRARNLCLVNPPDAYLTAHHLPRAYPWIEAVTPKTVWFPVDTAIETIATELRAAFGDAPVILKDYVKSQKHYWAEACFIPSAASAADIARVTQRFIELQADELVGGLVYRAFIPFEIIGQHPQSGLAVAKELRVFVLNGQVMSIHPYWEGFAIDYDPGEFEGLIGGIISRFPSHFYTIDLAKMARSNERAQKGERARSGEWMVVEVGDGQVSGIPDGRFADFYTALFQAE